jgi:hypothetical protein
MIDHANRYISSGSSEGHIYTVTPPGYSELHVPSLLFTTAGWEDETEYLALHLPPEPAARSRLRVQSERNSVGGDAVLCRGHRLCNQ